MTPPSLIDRIVAILYWPCLAATLVAMVTPFVAVWVAIDPYIVQLATIGFYAVTVFNGVMIMLDTDTRRAIDELRTYLRENREDLTFGDILFMKTGDLLFLICNRLMWFQMFFVFFAPRNLWHLWFAGFGISMTMVALSLKKDDSWG